VVFRSEEYYVRRVGHYVTAEVIKKYAEYHDNKQLAFHF
jgi:hypothetical protein